MIKTNVAMFNGEPTVSTTFTDFNELGELVYATVRIFYHADTDQWCVSRVRSWLDDNTDTFNWGTSCSYLSRQCASEAFMHIADVWERRCKQGRFFPKD